MVVLREHQQAMVVTEDLMVDLLFLEIQLLPQEETYQPQWANQEFNPETVVVVDITHQVLVQTAVLVVQDK